MGVVGFDLDMTLVDSADGIVTSITHVCDMYGVQPGPEAIRATIGLPLDMVFPLWLPDEPYETLLAQYRAHYREYGIPLTLPMPGAVEALAAIREQGDRILVVTAKYGAVADLVLDVAGLNADEVVGDLFAEAKGTALREHGAWAYVGDHPGDIRAARAADAHAIAVATGPTPPEDLRDADVVLSDLHELPEWLASAR